MIITKITGGIGNQLFQYAAGRRLAYKLNTELKLDNTQRDFPQQMSFGLDKFNINATFATHEEIASLRKINLMSEKGYIFSSEDTQFSLEEILNAPDNTYIQGWWINEAYFKDISDVLRKDLTLKEPLSPNAEAYKQKILSAECPVFMHFRHGDVVYNPSYRRKRAFGYIPPLERYSECIDFLKQYYKNLTAFVFSNNIPFIKENLHLDIPVEFVENCAHDVEDFYLMSLCKHGIKPGASTFSWWVSWLNQNPTKKILQLNPSNSTAVKNYRFPILTPEKDSPMLINVPFDREKDLQNIEMTPIFSLLLVVNNDATTIADTLDSLLAQDYEYYEIIIIDNASTDGSRKICRQKIEGKKNVTFKKLYSKVKNAKAWNMALKMAKGLYVSFLKGNDRFIVNALTVLYYTTEKRSDVISPIAWLEENENGTITIDDKKFSEKRKPDLQRVERNFPLTNGQDLAKGLINGQTNTLLSLKFFYRKFLMENKIKFDKNLDDNKAELFFQVETFFKSRYFFYIKEALYIAPKNN